jgi:hypothetical protein
MFDKRIRAGIAGALAACGLAVACIAPVAAQADPIGSGSGSGGGGCYYFDAGTGTDQHVDEGTLIIALSGSIYQCTNGEWVKVSQLVRTHTPIISAPPAVNAPPIK